ncbi:germin-like protein subfamily 3 member 4 [Tripterygium wilfordii]|uniref:germin-like protein subfamily 3 member 4 n=1 Tax=Tripterygium wilfordii TaxID=458696 RepID=UPI0018F7E8EA|nr:germin-like protein subfamily 3 member 4 [Tripterygium wilfordii]
MNPSLPFCFLLFLCIKICLADHDNLQDVCPTDMEAKETIFINGYPCKTPSTISASDFKTSQVNHPGDTDNFLRSSMNIVTAADFPGLNTLGLSIARTDLDVDGLILLHSHPRASEVLFVFKGVITAGFLDTQNQLFQRSLQEGDAFIFPHGLLHFCLNAGYEPAVIFSVLNSQNPGVVAIAGAMFEPEEDNVKKMIERIKSLSASRIDRGEDVTRDTIPNFNSEL